MAQFSRKSEWTFDTSASAGAGVGDGPFGASAETGYVQLSSPQKAGWKFYYVSVSAGAGLAAGVSIGSLSAGGSLAPSSLPSEGDVFIADGVAGELQSSDFEGFCTAMQVSVGVGVAKSLTVLVMGIPYSVIPQEMFRTSPVGLFLSWLSDHAPAQPVGTIKGIPVSLLFEGIRASVNTYAKAAVVMSGVSVGQFGGGISSGIGYVSGRAIPTPSKIVQMISPKKMDVTITDNTVTIVMNAYYVFDYGSSEIAARADRLLARIEGNMIARMPDRTVVECYDYTDDPNNRRDISERRAKSIGSRLEHKIYRAFGFVTTIGFGDTTPRGPGTIYGRDLDNNPILLSSIVVRLEYTSDRDVYGPRGPQGSPWNHLAFEFQNTDWFK